MRKKKNDNNFFKRHSVRYKAKRLKRQLLTSCVKKRTITHLFFYMNMIIHWRITFNQVKQWRRKQNEKWGRGATCSLMRNLDKQKNNQTKDKKVGVGRGPTPLPTEAKMLKSLNKRVIQYITGLALYCTCTHPVHTFLSNIIYLTNKI